jgi:RloB-like protein
VAARKSRRSRSVVGDRERYGQRPVKTRPPLPVVIVVCDDARTAVSYLNELKRIVKKTLTLKVCRNPCDRARPNDVVKEAAAQLRQYGPVGENDPNDKTQAWALIDLEQEPERRQAAKQAKVTGSGAGIRIALSDPCYEVWTLLHL